MFGLVALAGGGTPQASPAVASGELSVSWADDGSRVTVTGVGFRARSVVTARVGDVASAQAAAAVDGSVRIDVPVGPSATGGQGTSVILVGRSRSGSARTLVAATPPRATRHGPVDLAPRSVAAALGVVAVATVRDQWLARANNAVPRP
jgi:hypothetical protein